MPAFKKVKKSAAGAPVKLDRDLIKRICNVMLSGAYVETAVVVCGVSKTIFYDWCREAHKKDSDPIFKELLAAVERAMEECVVRDLMNIDKCAMGSPAEYERDEDGQLSLDGKGNPVRKRQAMMPDWSASAWRLERRHGKHWSKTEKVEHTGKDGSAIVTAIETEEDKLKRKARIAQLTKNLQVLDDDK